MWWPLLQAVEDASAAIAVKAFQGWIRHARRYFPCCLSRENTACDVDEVLWHDANRRQDAAQLSLDYVQTAYFIFSIVCSVLLFLYLCVLYLSMKTLQFTIGYCTYSM